MKVISAIYIEEVNTVILIKPMASERKMLFEKQFKDAFLHKKEESLDRKIKEFVIDSRIEQIFIEEINQSTVSKIIFLMN